MSLTLIKASLLEGIKLREKMLEMAEPIESAGRLWIDCLKQGGKILFAGNGGSAADAQHLAAELVGRFERANGFPALALTVDTSCLTALANDFGFEQVFSRQVLALGNPGDLLVGITTSGGSPNVVAALEAARKKGMKTLALTGETGGPAEALSDLCIKVPSPRTCRVQEIHLSLGHVWCEMVESALPSPLKA
ncbi:MAG: D-sedoheptulose 7-phosphate isomerase [Vulcanimicrobiota bacterium]